MNLFTENTTLIIPTRNRIFFLEELLKQLDLYKVNFLEKLIIDSSHISNSNYIKNLSKKHMSKYYITKASTSFQRNYGLKVVNKKAKYIMFLDDDVIFFKDSFYQMNRTIENNLKASGYGFNQITPLKDNLIDVILDYIKLNIADSKVIHNADGSRTVVLLPDQLSDVMLKATDHGLSGEMLDNLRSFLSDIPTQLELDVVRESLSNRQ